MFYIFKNLVAPAPGKKCTSVQAAGHGSIGA